MLRSFLALAAVLSIVISISSCAEDPADDWPELSLLQYSVPLTIHAPDSARVRSQTLSGIMNDVTVRSLEDDYDVQILASRAATNDMARLKSEQLDNVRQNRYFNRIVREEPNGFVFENRIDTLSTYGFRYIVYQGDQEFVFQNGFGATFGEEDIERMYAAVKQEE